MSLGRSDLDAFQKIVSKAKECGMLGALREHVDGQSSQPPSSDFTVITEQTAAMSDAFKHRATTEVADLQHPVPPSSMCTGYGIQKGKPSGEKKLA